MRYSYSLVKLLSLARKARKKIEHLSDYERGPANLKGYCGIASKYICKLANKENIFPTFVVGNFYSNNDLLGGHCWIEYENKIIDITATQFKINEKVFVVSKLNNHYKLYASGVEAEQIVDEWHCMQLNSIIDQNIILNK